MQAGVLPGGQVGRAQRRLSGLLTCAVIRASPTTMPGRSSPCSTLPSCVGRMVALGSPLARARPYEATPRDVWIVSMGLCRWLGVAFSHVHGVPGQQHDPAEKEDRQRLVPRGVSKSWD